ncbi:class I SAM-dependent rRNA methyltransferase [Paraliomyxa miuraensis]|uniref:class I SAM-dependent rRNA methyltransferase n=1 Tax=Paraliomyxa miuraensis TaxID=376150 RepID=UPI002259DC27|nr:class I SAM-dependent rRNA methyltransferase [Paraliomyxa miuraensis]MCX4245115.1 class I SAM-dependent rRNA methyltransferase [Paraliomyxa miuraensis]
MDVPHLRLGRSLVRTIRRGHPWVYRDALEGRIPAPGLEVAVTDGRGQVVARGLCEAGPIGVRLWTVGDEPVSDALMGRRLDAAIELRRSITPRRTDALRLVHGEGDRMPGVVVDLYGPHAVLALDGEAAVAHRERLVSLLMPRLRALGVPTLVVRSGPRGDRTIEHVQGPPPPEVVEVLEHGMVLCADLMRGQKTGLFLDQRSSRAMVRRLAKGRRVLDLYAYVGGFSAAAGKGGASSVVTVDLAKPAIAMAQRTWAANGLRPQRQRVVAADVPEFLAGLEANGERFDLVIADPPSFAPSAASRDKALRSYERLHGACLRVLAPGGLLLAASCSSHVDRAAFEDALAGAAQSQRVVLQVLDRWAAPPDHPRLLAFPEGDYLTVTLVRILP